MLFVFVSHFAYGFFGAELGGAHETLTAIGMVASPAFVIVSGLMLGFVYRSSRSRFMDLRSTFIDRGLFLLTIGHLLILGAHLPLGRGLMWGFITDTIGASMIAGVLLIDKIAPAARLVVSAGLYAGSWLMALFWQPEGIVLQALRDSLTGTAFQSMFVYNFPVLPWFSLYLAATVLGEKLAVAKADGAGSAASHNVLGRLGIATILSGLVGVGLSIALLFGGPGSRALEEARLRGGIVGEAIVAAEALAQPHPMDPWLELSSPFQKRPPSPVYFAFFGGTSLALLYLCRGAERRGWLSRLIRILARSGRASLFVFVAQYYVFFAVLRSVKLPTTIWWPVPLIGLSGILVYSGIAWERRGWNRLLTVGYPWLARQAKARKHVWTTQVRRAVAHVTAWVAAFHH